MAAERSLTTITRDWLAPTLDRAFAGVAAPDEIWAIDRLAVDLPAIAADRLEQDFAKLLEEAVARALRDCVTVPGTGRPSPEKSSARGTPSFNESVPDEDGGAPAVIQRRTSSGALLEAFSYFLERGALPWWYRLPEGRAFEQVLLAAWLGGVPPVGYRNIVMAAAAMPAPTVSLIRLVRQFSPRFLEPLLESIRPGSVQAIPAILARIDTRISGEPERRRAREQVWLAAFHDAATASPGQASALPRLIRAWDRPTEHPVSPTKDKMDGAEENRTADAPTPEQVPPSYPSTNFDLAEGLLVDCAGVVLLHPFLPQLFATLGLVEGDMLTDPDRALGLLHYLATGQPSAPEHVLLLPKLLCNLSLEPPTGAPVTLGDAERAEADAMLAAVIDHWDALGSISVDTLRGSFLLRLGRIARRGDDIVLQVEPQSFDILLDRLPWGVSAVRLPWMPTILWVEWTA